MTRGNFSADNHSASLWARELGFRRWTLGLMLNSYYGLPLSHWIRLPFDRSRFFLQHIDLNLWNQDLFMKKSKAFSRSSHPIWRCFDLNSVGKLRNLEIELLNHRYRHKACNFPIDKTLNKGSVTKNARTGSGSSSWCESHYLCLCAQASALSMHWFARFSASGNLWDSSLPLPEWKHEQPIRHYS